MGSVKALVQTQEFDKLATALDAWSELLSLSARDIEKTVNRKKMSRAVIRYEIHLRAVPGEMRNLKYKVPEEHHEPIDAWVNRAEEVRKRLVDILFDLSGRSRQ